MKATKQSKVNSTSVAAVYTANTEEILKCSLCNSVYTYKCILDSLLDHWALGGKVSEDKEQVYLESATLILNLQKDQGMSSKGCKWVKSSLVTFFQDFDSRMEAPPNGSSNS